MDEIQSRLRYPLFLLWLACLCELLCNPDNNDVVVHKNVSECWCFEWLGQMLLSMILETLPSRHYFFRNDFNTEILRNFDLGSRFWKLISGE